MMSRIRIVILFLGFLILCISGIAQKESFKVVGYYSLNNALDIVGAKEVPFKRLTHINLWFLNPDTLGNFPNNYSLLNQFVTRAHNKRVKVLVSIGGGSKQPQYRELLRENAKRTQLIKNLLLFANQYNLDGIDVDLEGSDIDENYEIFVTELAKELHQQHKLITAAIAVYYKDQLTDRALACYDFVNVMSYDRTGPWRPEKPGPHSTYAHAVEDIEYFRLARSIPKEKITLGVPFYGYGFGPDLTSPTISMNYQKIVTDFPGSEQKDEWLMPGGKTIYYNGIPTIKQKVFLAKKKASGIMIWQLRGDALGKKSLLRVIYKYGQRK